MNDKATALAILWKNSENTHTMVDISSDTMVDFWVVPRLRSLPPKAETFWGREPKKCYVRAPLLSRRTRRLLWPQKEQGQNASRWRAEKIKTTPKRCRARQNHTTAPRPWTSPTNRWTSTVGAVALDFSEALWSLEEVW